MSDEAYTGFTALVSGMNSGLRPTLLKSTEFAVGNNVSVRDGYLKTRGGFEEVYDAGTAAAGSFRGADTWRLHSGDWSVLVIGTTIVVRSHESGNVHVFGGYLTDAVTWCHFEQADRWMVIQSGVDRPVVLEVNDAGVPVVFGVNPPEVALVKATIMQYAHQRLFMVPVVVPQYTPDPDLHPTAIPNDEPGEDGRVGIVAADVRDNLNPEWLFRMREHRNISQGGILTLPLESGFVTGMGVLRGAPTGTGVGALIVFGEEAVHGYNVETPRAQWLSTNISQALFPGAGTYSSRGIVGLNDDLVYIDTTGNVRFMRYDISELAGSGGVLHNIPKSNEMKYWVKQGSAQDLENVSAVSTDNRFFWTMIGDDDGTYKALGVLDTIPAYSMQVKQPEAYYGVWTGFKFLQVVKARESRTYKMFVWVLHDNKIKLLRYNEDAITDVGGVPILSTAVTAVYDFSTENVATATDIKQLRYCELWVDDVKRNTDFSVYFRPRGYPEWTLMGTRSISVPGGLAQGRRQTRITLDLVGDICDPVSKVPLWRSDRFQFMIRWRGCATIEACRFVALKMTGEEQDVCATDNEDGAVYTDSGADFDFDYEV